MLYPEAMPQNTIDFDMHVVADIFYPKARPKNTIYFNESATPVAAQTQTSLVGTPAHACEAAKKEQATAISLNNVTYDFKIVLCHTSHVTNNFKIVLCHNGPENTEHGKWRRGRGVGGRRHAARTCLALALRIYTSSSCLLLLRGNYTKSQQLTACSLAVARRCVGVGACDCDLSHPRSASYDPTLDSTRLLLASCTNYC
jgi:hypothetical protein